MALGVGQDCLDAILRDFKLLRDFSDADAIIEVIDNRADWHPGAPQHRSAALHIRIDFYERALRPVDLIRQRLCR